MKKTFTTFFLLLTFTVVVFAQGTGGNTGGNDGTGGNTTGNDGTGGNNKPAYCSSIPQSELETSIIPCGRKVHICYSPENAECGFHHLFILVNNMARNFIAIVFAPLLTVMLMYIGFLFIKDQAGALVKAKTLLLRLLIGTLFVLGAWLIVNFILNVLGVTDEVKKPLSEQSQ